MQHFPLDVIVTRGAALESRHRVHSAVVDARGTLVGGSGDTHLVTPWRSCAKPFQVLPFLDSGGFDTLGWGDDALALACASHGGEPEHVGLARTMLVSLGLEEGDLACGPHEPLARRGARHLRESGEAATRLHNNCSGKHAAMLARARAAGWATQGYERQGHPVQDGCLRSVAEWAGLKLTDIGQAIDGCGVVVFSLPLAAMSTAYAKWSAATRATGNPQRVARAMAAHPFLVGGTDRFDTVLLEETHGRVIAKIGAEGVHSAAALDLDLGVTVKVEDGAARAQYPALIRLLQLVGALPAELPPRLQDFAVTRVRNTRHEVVGDVRCAEGAAS